MMWKAIGVVEAVLILVVFIAFIIIFKVFYFE